MTTIIKRVLNGKQIIKDLIGYLWHHARLDRWRYDSRLVPLGIAVFIFLTPFTLHPSPLYAADTGADFEAVDDMTVSGTEGTKNDADLEVKGVSSFAKDVFVESGILAGPYGGIGRYQNLLKYSDALGDTNGWAQAAITVASGATSVYTAPDGTLTAEELTASGATGVSRISQSTALSLVNGDSVTFSVWAKAGTNTTLGLRITFSNSADGSAYQDFTLTDQWQRFSYTRTTSDLTGYNGNTYAWIYPKTGNDSTIDSGTIYAWGAQLEQSSTPGVYVKTTVNAITASRGIVSDADTVIKGNLTVDGTITGMTATGGGWTDGGTSVYLATTTDNVGIGTTTPGQVLDVRGSIALGENGTKSILSENGGLRVDVPDDGATDHVRFTQGVTEWARIQEGKMSMGGAVTPRQILDLTGDNNSIGLYTDAGGGSSFATINWRDDTGLTVATSPATHHIILNPAGNVGIGTTNPGAKLDIKTTANPETAIKFSGVNGGSISSGGGGITLSADDRLVLQGSNSNYVNIGGSSADFVDISGYMRIIDGGNVGIGTTGPTEKLDVSGNISLGTANNKVIFYYNGSQATLQDFIGTASGNSGNLGIVARQDVDVQIDSDNGAENRKFAIFNGSTTIGGGTELFRVQGNGNVGIGTTGPGRLLDVNGTANFASTAYFYDGGVSTPAITFANDPDTGIARVNANSMVLTAGGSEKVRINDGGMLMASNIALNGNYLSGDGANEGIFVNSSGSVGINTASPEAKLDVAGPLRINSAGDTGIAQDLVLTNIDASTIKSYSPLTIQSGGSNDNYNLTLKGTGTGKVYIDDDLEITGTTTFPTGLTVSSGNITASTGNVSASAGSGTFGSLTVTGNTNLATTSGNVGIGTTSPTTDLDVVGNINASGYIQGTELDVGNNTNGAATLYINNTSTGANARSSAVLFQSGSQFVHLDYINSGADNSSITAIPNSASLFTGTGATGGLSLLTQANAPIIFGTGGINFSNERMRITGTGNVGIGTTNPTAKLYLNAAAGDLITAYSSTNVFNVENNGDVNAQGINFWRGTTAKIEATGDKDIEIIPNVNKHILLETSGTGNVGIGTTGPGAGLHVVSDSAKFTGKTGNNTVTIEGANTSSRGYLNLVGDGATFTLNEFGGSARITYPGELQFGNTSNYNRITMQADGDFIVNSGNIGIGTTGPSSALAFKAGTTGITFEPADVRTKAMIYPSGTNSEHLYVRSAEGGNLYLMPGSTGTGSIYIQGNGPGDFYVQTDADSDFNIGSGQLFVKGSDGNVGIGTTDPGAYRLNVQGGNINTSGTITASGGTSTNWNTAYSERLQWDGGSTNLTAATGRISLGLVIGTNVQAYDADLDDLADGSLSGSLIGSGISATNITTGTLGTDRYSAYSDLQAENYLGDNADTDLTSKLYVDNAIAGLKWKQSVRISTTTAGTLATSFANGQTVDGVALVTGNRILIKDQSTGSENGIYTVNASGAPTRATDADISSELLQTAVFIEEGTTNADTAWVCNTNAPITLNTTALTFTQFTGAAAYVWENGLSNSGNIINVGAGIGIDVDGTNVIHEDLSTQASVDNSNGTVIQDVTMDTLGHVTGLASVDLDGRYVDVSGDTMTGSLNIITSAGDNPIDMNFKAGGVVQPWRFIFPSSVNGGSLGAGANNFGIYNATAGEYLLTLKTDKSIQFGSGTISSSGNLAVTGSSASYFNGGNVGIGTTNPQRLLDISGTSPIGIRLKASADVSNFVDILHNTNPAIGTTFNNAYGGAYSFQQGGTTVFYIDNDVAGNVGIGTTNPTRNLDVVGTGYFTNTLTGSGGGFVAGSSNVDVNSRDLRLVAPASVSSNQLAITADNITTGNAIFITADGLSSGSGISIDSTSTAATTNYLIELTASGAANSSTRYGVYSSLTGTGTSSTNIAGYFSATGATNNYGLIIANGNVGIGTTGPGAKLHVSGGDILLDNALNLSWKDGAGTKRDIMWLRSDNSLRLINPVGALEIQTSTAQNASFWGGTSGTGRTLALSGTQTSADGAINDSPTLLFETEYDSDPTAGVTMSVRNASFIHDMLVGGASPQSALKLSVGGSSNLLTLYDNNGTGNIGIGTISPGQKLQVVGTIESTSGGFKFPDGTTQTSAGAAGGWVDGGTNVYLATSTDSVGIGTTGPGAKLDVNGNFKISGNSSSFSMDAIGFSAGNTVDQWIVVDSNGINLRGIDGKPISMATDASVNVGVGYTLAETLAGTAKLAVNGNVGIGTTVSNQKLSVAGNINLTTGGYLYGDTVAPYLQLNSATGTVLTFNPTNYIQIGSGDIKAYAGSWFRIIDPASNEIRFHVGSTTGSVGINTTSPEAKLDVQGPMRVSSAGDVGISHDLYFEDTTTANINSYGPLTIQSGNPNSNYNLVLKGTGTGKVIVDDDFSATGNIELGDASADTVSIHGTVIGASPALFVNQSSADDIVVVQDSGTNVFKILDGGNSYFMGNLGIGTTAPTNKLHVAGGNVLVNNTVTGATQLRLSSIGSGVSAGLLTDDGAGAEIFSLTRQASNTLSISSYGNIGLVGGATGGPSTGYQMYLKSDGNVGIGTTNPTSRLVVAGNINPSASDTYNLGSSNSLYWNEVWADDYYGNTINARNPEDLVFAGWGGHPSISLDVDEDIVLSFANGGNFYVDNNSLFVNSVSGNVGIGTTNPLAMLQIGDGSATGTFRLYGPNSSRYFYISNNNDATVANALGHLTLQAENSLFLNSGNVNRIAVDNSGNVNINSGQVYVKQSNGNVGIGTTVPGAKLEVQDPSQVSLKIRSPKADTYSWTSRLLISRATDARSGGIWIEADNDQSWFVGAPYNDGNDSGGFSIGRHSTQPEYKTNSLVFINDTGNVGIGTTNPISRLHAVGGNVGISSNQGFGTELVTNNGNWIGDFDLQTDIDTWTDHYGNGTETLNSGGMKVTIVGAGSAAWEYRTITVETGVLYYYTMTILSGGTVNGHLMIGTGSGNSAYVNYDGVGPGTYTGTFTPSGASATISLKVNSTVDGASTIFDNISLRKANVASSYALQVASNLTTDLFKVGDNAITVPYTGNVGIGSTAPSKKLDVVGDINFTGSLYQSGSPYIASQWITSGASIYYNTGNVGIGTTGPNEKLHLGSGNIQIDSSAGAGRALQVSAGALVLKTINGGNPILFGIDGTTQMALWGSGTGLKIGDYTTEKAVINPNVADGATAVAYTFDTKNTLAAAGAKLLSVRNNTSEKFTIDNAGNVGIGTTGPDAVLDIVKDISAGSAAKLIDLSGATLSDDYWFYIDSNTFWKKESTYNYLKNQYIESYGYIKSPRLLSNGNILIDSDSDGTITIGDGTSNVIFGSSGNVGIGTTAPLAGLSITKSIAGDGVSTNPPQGGLVVANSGADADASFGDDNSGGYHLNLYIKNNTIGLREGDNKQWSAAQSSIGFGSGLVLGSHDGYAMTFKDGTTENMRITGAGNVGIGTTVPLAKLNVLSDDASANAVTNLLFLSHTTSGTAAAGIGGGLVFENEDVLGTSYAGAIEGILTDANNGQERGALIFKTLDVGGRSVNAQTPMEAMRIDRFGNVGIGTTDPGAYKLNVNGNTNITGTLTATGAINGQTIGSTSAFNALTVGNGYGSSGITMDTNGNLQVDGNIYLKGKVWEENLQKLSVYNNTIRLNSGGSSQDAKIEVEGTAAATLTTIQWNNAASNWSIDKGLNITSGNVGIGTTNPEHPFQITQSANSRLAFYTTNTDAASRNWDIRVSQAVHGDFSIEQSNAKDGNPMSNGTVRFNINPTGNVSIPTGALTVSGTGNSSFAGNVGIGTTGPLAKLEITGSGASAALKLFDTDVSGAAYGKTLFYQDGDTLTMQSYYANEAGSGSLASFGPSSIVLSQNVTVNGKNLYVTGTGPHYFSQGNVGIGTTGPNYKLDIKETIGSAGSRNLLRLWSGTAGSEKALAIKIDSTENNPIIDYTEDRAGGTASNFRFGSSLFIAAGWPQNSGNVGIGTTAPRSKFDTWTGTMTGAANDYEKAQFTMSGGGTVTWGGTGNRLQWTARFIAIPVQRTTTASAGYIDINQPTIDIPAGQVFDGVARSATSAGVVLNSWEALYAAHTVGGNNTAITYYIVKYTVDFNPPSNWLLVAAINGDNNTAKLGTGVTLKPNGSWSGGIDSQYVQLQGSTPGTQQTGHLNVSGTGIFGGNVNVSGTGIFTGNVGMGTASPKTGLTLWGANSREGLSLYNIYDSLTAGLYSIISTGNAVQIRRNTDAAGNFGTFTTPFIINSSDNVGIGTMSPSSGKLQVYAASGNLAYFDGTNDAYIDINGNFNAQNGIVRLGNVNGAAGLTSGSTARLALGVNNSEKVSIQNDGKVGIGTTQPRQLLDISGGRIVLDAEYMIQWYSGVTPTGNGLVRHFTGGDASYYGFDAYQGATVRFYDNFGMSLGNTYALTTPPPAGAIIQGNVGIGTAAPGYKLEIQGDVGIGGGKALYNTAAGTSAGGIRVDEAVTNLVTNPSFETGLTGWGDVTLTRVSTASKFGSYSVYANQAVTGSPLMTYVVTVSPSTTYTMSTYIKTANVAGTGAGIQVNAGGVWTASWGETGTQDWHRKSLTFQTGAGVTSATLYIELNGSTGEIWFDGVQLEQKGYATSYADGSLGTGYAWTGTAHASTSTRTAGGIVVDKDATIIGGLNVLGSMNLGDVSTDNIIMNGTLQAPTNTDVIISPQGTGNVNLTGTLKFSGVTTDITTGTGEHLALMPNGTGNVGVGTTNPRGKLTVSAGGIYLDNNQSIYARNVADLGDVAILRLSANNDVFMDTGASMGDDDYFNLGTDLDYRWKYDSGDNRLELTDGGITNLFMVIKDQGTTADFDFNAGKVFFKNDGNVGIGTTGPSSLFHINGGSGASLEYLRMSGTAGGYAQYAFARNNSNDLSLNMFAANGSLTATPITFQYGATGNVGIGTTGPGKALDVNGDIRLANTGALYLHSNGNNFLTYNTLQSDAGSPFTFKQANNQPIDFYTNNAFAVRINNTGNVGIGTTVPGYLLDVQSTTTGNIAKFYGTGGLALIQVGANGYINSGGGQLQIYGASGVPLSLGSNNAVDKLVIATTGNVGIGTTGPGARLDVSGDGRFHSDSGVKFYSTGDTDWASIDRYGVYIQSGNIWLKHNGTADLGTIRNFRLVQNTDQGVIYSENTGAVANTLYLKTGIVGIGTASPEAKLDVAGPLRINSAGDTGVAQDLVLTNIDASTIKSYSPLTIQSGGSNDNYNLTLKGTGTGKVYIDDDLEITGTTTFPTGLTVASGNITASTGNVSASAGSGTFGTLTVTGNANLATTSGNVGIGTTAPGSYKLNVNGSLLAQTTITAYNDITSAARIISNYGASINNNSNDSDTWIKGTTDASLFYVDASANGIGIGYNNPGTAKLAINGNVGIGTAGPRAMLELASETTGAYPSFLLADAGDDTDYWIARVNDAGGNDNDTLQIGDGAVPGTNPFLTINTSGNVGIGTTGPTAKFVVNGGNSEIWSNTGVLWFRGNNGAAADVSFGIYGYGAATLDIGDSNDNVKLANSTLIANATTGNVGIGTTGPGKKLDVSGGEFRLINSGNSVARIASTGSGDALLYFDAQDGDFSGGDYSWMGQGDSGLVYWRADAGAGSIQLQTGAGGANTFTFTQGGNVGIGTTNPGQRLEVNGSVKITTSGYSRVLSANQYGNLSVDGGVVISGYQYRSDNGSGMELSTSQPGAIIAFAPGSDNLEKIRFTSIGNVGIGTTGPAEKLDVVGNIKLTGRIRQGSMGDVAEMMALSPMVLRSLSSATPIMSGIAVGIAGESLLQESALSGAVQRYAMPQPNDVVMIDRDGGIRLSDAPNSTQVIGVISVNPAQILREDLPNSLPVALSGTVPCKATTENGPIYPGDLLTSSSKPGYAMKADPPKIGTIIGKAMEPLEQGEGEILIFVTRQ